MRFQLHASPRPSSAGVPPAPSLAADTPAPPAAPPSIRIDRLQIEGCGPISGAAVRDGFRDAWLRADHAAQPWTPAAAEIFGAPLALDLPPGLGGRELGQRLAEAILRRANTSATRD